MGTFLVTPRMDPALRARVERAVSRGARARFAMKELGMAHAPFRERGGMRGARLFPVVVALLVAVLAGAGVLHDRRAMEADRRALLAALGARRAALPTGLDRLLAADRLLAVSAVDLPDHVAPALRGPGALDAALRRPALYVHGVAAELRDPLKIDVAARTSTKDAFLVCLLQPPPSPAEKDMLPRVRGVYFGGAKVDTETASVRRLAEARLALAALRPAFEETARGTTDRGVLRVLRRDLDAVPVEQARRAALAELLLIVADDPADPAQPTREARVTMVDLGSGEVLLRLRRRPADQGTSSMASLHRADLEGCDLALGVRRAVAE